MKKKTIKSKELLKVVGVLSIIVIPVLFALYYFINQETKKMELYIENQIYSYQDQSIGEGLFFGFNRVKCNYSKSIKCIINNAFIYGRNDKYTHKLLNLNNIKINFNQYIDIPRITLDKEIKEQLLNLTQDKKNLNNFLKDLEPISLKIKGLFNLRKSPKKEKFVSLQISNKLLSLSSELNIYINNINGQNINFLEYFKGTIILYPQILNTYFNTYKMTGNRLNNKKVIQELNFNFLGKRLSHKIDNFNQFKHFLQKYKNNNYNQVSKILNILAQDKKVLIDFNMKTKKKINNKDKFALASMKAITKFKFKEFQKNNYHIKLSIKGI